MWLHNKVFVVFFNNVRRPLTRGLMMVLHQQTYGPITFLRAVPEHDWTPSLQRDSCPPASCETGCSLHCLLAGDRALRFTLRLRDLISNSLRERQDRNFYSRLYRGGSERILHQPSPHCHVTGKANKRTGREAGKLQALSPRRGHIPLTGTRSVASPGRAGALQLRLRKEQLTLPLTLHFQATWHIPTVQSDLSGTHLGSWNEVCLRPSVAQ